MNKELFVSTTPHETKVGITEDDQLAEIYLERENEYTLAGSIYKGRVTRVLPGMQSAFVDIGLERDAFLYVSDFMELEEHDDDLTDVVPANRGVQDLRSQPIRGAADAATAGAIIAAKGAIGLQNASVPLSVPPSEVPREAPSLVFRGPQLSPRRHVRRNPAEPSRQDRLRDTRRCCCPGSRFRSIEAMPPSHQRKHE